MTLFSTTLEKREATTTSCEQTGRSSLLLWIKVETLPFSSRINFLLFLVCSKQREMLPVFPEELCVSSRSFKFAVQNANSKDLELTQSSSGKTDRVSPCFEPNIEKSEASVLQHQGLRHQPQRNGSESPQQRQIASIRKLFCKNWQHFALF